MAYDMFSYKEKKASNLRKTTKTLVATTLALSTLFGVGVTSALTDIYFAHL